MGQDGGMGDGDGGRGVIAEGGQRGQVLEGADAGDRADQGDSGWWVGLGADGVGEGIGGGAGVTEDALTTNYASACDPRLNYSQALELAFILAARMRT